MLSQTLRNKTPNEEIDYLFLNDILKYYNQPRMKIGWLLKNGVIIRIKKGLYVFGPDFSRKPFSKEVLANLIYGPSYISLEYALYFYNIIPERVETVTSITCKRNKEFNTPAGRFTYRYLHPHKYFVGVTQHQLDETHQILIATPEKALFDFIQFSAGTLHLENDEDIYSFLFEDMRFDQTPLFSLDLKQLNEIDRIVRNPQITMIFQYLQKRSRL